MSTANDHSALVHVGTHKTGTTSFQWWAAATREELRATTGLEYYSGLFHSSHWELPMLCLDEDRNMPMRLQMPDWCLDEWQRDVAAHIRHQVAQPAASLLISSEALSYLRRAEEVERLVDLLSPRRVSVIAVLREPASFLRSYREMLSKLGVAPSPYRRSFAYVEDDSWLVDYGALLDAYRDVLGPDSVLTIDYEEAMRRHGSIIPAILGRWGIDPAQAPDWRDFHIRP